MSGSRIDVRVVATLVATLLLPVSVFGNASLIKAAEEFSPRPDEQRAGAAVLLVEEVSEVDVQRHYRTTRLVRIAIVSDDAAAAYGQISVSFNSHYSNLQLDHAQIVDASGALHEVSPDAVQTVPTSTGDMYNDSLAVKFAMPAVRSGSVLEFKWTEESKRQVIPGHWYSRGTFHHTQWTSVGVGLRLDPVRRATVTVRAPRDLELISDVSVLDRVPRETVTDGNRVLSWELEDVAGVVLEEQMATPWDAIPRYFVSTLAHWREIDRWAADIYLPIVRNTPAVSGRLASLTESSTGVLSTAQEIFYYLQEKIRYVSADVKRGGFVPHEPSTVLRNGYGDCKDQSTLLVSLLRKAGFDAFPALTGFAPGPEVNASVPSLQFSHMVVYVPDGKDGIWLDASGNAGDFPGLEWSLQGRTAFVVNGQGGELRTIPRSGFRENGANVKTDYRWKGDDLIANVAFDVHGAMNGRFKQWVKHNASREQELKRWIQSLYEKATIQSIRISNADDDRKPFRVEASLRFTQSGSLLDRRVQFGGGISRLLAAYSGILARPAPDRRRYAYDAGMEVTLRSTEIWHSPETGYVPVVLSRGLPHEGAAFDVTRRIDTNDESVIVTTEFRLKTGKIPGTKYQQFHAALSRAIRQSEWRAVFRPGRNAVRKDSSADSLSANATDVPALIARIKSQIDVGEYQKALSLADRAVSMAPRNGEAHYLRGLALGFLDRFKASENAIARSRNLGFKP